MDTRDTMQLVEQLAAHLSAKGWRLVTAESCTGGLIAAACTELAGSSAWFERGFVTYSNEAKTELLGVPAALIAAHGAVSEPVARAMAEGALRGCPRADLAVAVTGIAGPAGGSPDKPVGTVWLAWAWRGEVSATAPGGIRCDAERQLFKGDRVQVRRATCELALRGLGMRLA
jgi:nicotinamide-nucleotide amidase